ARIMILNLVIVCLLASTFAWKEDQQRETCFPRTEIMTVTRTKVTPVYEDVTSYYDPGYISDITDVVMKTTTWVQVMQVTVGQQPIVYTHTSYVTLPSYVSSVSTVTAVDYEYLSTKKIVTEVKTVDDTITHTEIEPIQVTVTSTFTDIIYNTEEYIGYPPAPVNDYAIATVPVYGPVPAAPAYDFTSTPVQAPVDEYVPIQEVPAVDYVPVVFPVADNPLNQESVSSLPGKTFEEEHKEATEDNMEMIADDSVLPTTTEEPLPLFDIRAFSRHARDVAYPPAADYLSNPVAVYDSYANDAYVPSLELPVVDYAPAAALPLEPVPGDYAHAYHKPLVITFTSYITADIYASTVTVTSFSPADYSEVTICPMQPVGDIVQQALITTYYETNSVTQTSFQTVPVTEYIYKVVPYTSLSYQTVPIAAPVVNIPYGQAPATENLYKTLTFTEVSEEVQTLTSVTYKTTPVFDVTYTTVPVIETTYQLLPSTGYVQNDPVVETLPVELLELGKFGKFKKLLKNLFFHKKLF
ncbi:hypothetical protein SK128_006262, partial [Halocaridina rubra]